MGADTEISNNKNPFYWGKQFLAKRVGNSINPKNIIIVAGSSQVEITSFYITSVLSLKFNTKTTSLGKDPYKGLLDCLVKLRPNINKLVVGIPITRNGDVKKYLEVIRPGLLVISQLFDQKEYILDLNSEIDFLIEQIPSSSWTILNFDNKKIKKFSETTNSQIFSIGTDNQVSKVWADEIRLENFSTVFGLNHGVERVEVNLKSIGRHFIYPALSAAAIGIIHGLSLMSIKKGLESLENIPNNLELREGIKGWWVLDDCFDNDPVSLIWALQVLSDFGAKRKILILGEARDMTFNQSEVAEEIIKIKPDLVLLSGQTTNDLASDLVKLGLSPAAILKDQTNSEIVNKVLTYGSKGDVILIKGAKHLRFDEVIERISKHPKV